MANLQKGLKITKWWSEVVRLVKKAENTMVSRKQSQEKQTMVDNALYTNLKNNQDEPQQ